MAAFVGVPPRQAGATHMHSACSAGVQPQWRVLPHPSSRARCRRITSPSTSMGMVKEHMSKNSQISRDVIFRNSRISEEIKVRLRPLTPDDDLREQHFVDGMDEKSHEMRFFGPKRVHSKKEIEGMTHIDYRDDFALCCLDQISDEFVGIARYYSLSHDVKNPNHNVVEVAVVVNETCQGFGMGLYLMYQLLDVAVHEGKTVAVAEVLQRNRNARHLFERLMVCIPEATERTVDDVVEYRLPLTLRSDAADRVHGPYLNLTYEQLLTGGTQARL